MKIEFLILADAAQVANGKLFILGGGWSVYRSGNYPAQLQLALGLSFLIGWSEAAIRHSVSITIADEAGLPIIPEIKGHVEVGQPEELLKGTTQKALLAVNANIAIPHPGKYVVTATAGSFTAQTFFDAIFAGERIELPADPASERGN